MLMGHGKSMSCSDCKVKTNLLWLCQGSFCTPQQLVCEACYVPLVGKRGRVFPKCFLCWDALLALEDEMPCPEVPCERTPPYPDNDYEAGMPTRKRAKHDSIRMRASTGTNKQKHTHLQPAECKEGDHVCIPCEDHRCNSTCVLWTADHCKYACIHLEY